MSTIASRVAHRYHASHEECHAGEGCQGGCTAVAPPGWEGPVKEMKKDPGIDNPWALAWWQKGEGHQPHKEAALVQRVVLRFADAGQAAGKVAVRNYAKNAKIQAAYAEKNAKDAEKGFAQFERGMRYKGDQESAARGVEKLNAGYHHARGGTEMTVYWAESAVATGETHGLNPDDISRVEAMVSEVKSLLQRGKQEKYDDPIKGAFGDLHEARAKAGFAKELGDAARHLLSAIEILAARA